MSVRAGFARWFDCLGYWVVVCDYQTFALSCRMWNVQRQSQLVSGAVDYALTVSYYSTCNHLPDEYIHIYATVCSQK